MAISRALMERQLRKGGGMMDAVPRQQYGLGSFVRSITKPISKIADKFIPNEITRTINKIPAPVRTAAMFIPGVGQYMALANAASTLARSQGRGLSLGDIANLGLSYYGYGKGGGKLPGGADLPGFTGEEFTAFDGILGTEEASRLKTPSSRPGPLDATVTDPVVTEPTFATPDKVLATGDGAAMEATYKPRFGKTVGMEVAPGTPPTPSAPVVTPDFKGVTDEFIVESAGPQLGERGFVETLKTEGVVEALKEGAADFVGLPEIKEIQRAVGPKDTAFAILDYGIKNPSAIITSTSAMAYLTTPEPLPGETLVDFENRQAQVNSFIQRYSSQLGSDVTDFDSASDFYARYRSNLGYAEGGRAGRAFGGIMDIPMGQPRDNGAGITELDYRQDGGFVPIGIKEKADDVPAMLSKNEFVMTADAVRGAGNGDIEKGAQKMYDTMKQLESRVV